MNSMDTMPNHPTKIKTWANVAQSSTQKDGQPNHRLHTTSTFRSDFEAQLRSTNKVEIAAKQGETPAKDIPDISMVTSQMSAMRMTIRTLNDDMSRRTLDLIQARQAIETRDAEIKNLKDIVSTLKEQADTTAKDKELMKLKFENAGLRDALHTGIINVSHLYGPGGVQSFTHEAGRKVLEAEQGAVDFANSWLSSQATSAVIQSNNDEVPVVEPSIRPTPSIYPVYENVANRTTAHVNSPISTKEDASVGSNSVNKPTVIETDSGKQSPSASKNNSVKLVEPDQTNKAYPGNSPIDGLNTEAPVVRLPSITTKGVHTPTGTVRSLPIPEGSSQSMALPEDSHGEWINISAKNRPKKAINGNKKWKRKEKGKGMEAQKSTTQVNQVQPSQKESGVTQGSQGHSMNAQRHNPTKRTKGTVIGSASSFSQKPAQAKELPVHKDGKAGSSSTSAPKTPERTQAMDIPKTHNQSQSTRASGWVFGRSIGG